MKFSIVSRHGVLPCVLVLLAAQALCLADMQMATYVPSQQDRFYVGSDKNFVGAAFDWSGVGQASWGGWATMISPQYFVSATHWHPSGGDVITFNANNDPSGPTYQGTVDSWSYQTSYNGIGSDLWLGKLTAPIPTNITYYPVLNLPSPSDYIGLMTYVNGKPNRVGQSIIDSIRVASEPELTTPYKSTVSMEYAFNTVSGLGANEVSLIGGDSGGPSFVNAGGQLAIVGTHYYNWGTPDIYYWGLVSGDSFIPHYIDQLNANMVGQQITSVTLPGAVRWTLAGSGSWGVGANWTSGTPGTASLVFIDPSPGCTVTGPAAPASIQSLTLGAAGGTASALQLQLGGNLTVTGALTVNGAGQLFTNGANVSVASVLSDGSITINGGTFTTTGAENHGHGTGGAGQVTQTGGTHNVGGNLVLALNYNTSGTYLLQGGNLNVTGTAYVGYKGLSGVFNQTGGACTVGGDLNIGTIVDDPSQGYIPNGNYILGGGASLTVHGTAYVGASANGTFTQNGGTLTDSGGSAASMIVRQVAAATGTFQGNGVVGFRGSLTNNGRVIANGGTLDLSSFAHVYNTIANSTTNGWFATHATAPGRLILPTISVTGGGTYCWGDSAGASALTLVNSVKAATAGTGSLAITLQDRAFIAGTNRIGPGIIDVWDVTASGGASLSGAISFRVDNAQGGDSLRMFYTSSPTATTGWTQLVTSDNATTHVLTVASAPGSGYYILGTPHAGDVTLDGMANIDDFSVLLSHWGNSGQLWTTGDLTGDTVVNIDDFSVLLANWGQSASLGSGFSSVQTTPEPTTLVLLGLGGLAALRRRRSPGRGDGC